jgi:dolichyl-phosphate-mannose-protein mannosyltransferase
MHLALILVVGLALRLWLACTAEVVARDSTVYMEMAQRHSAGASLSDLRARHPGYPIALATTRNLLVFLGAPEGRVSWELAGRGISVLSSLLALAAAWLLARWAFGASTALLTGLLLAVASKWAALGAEILSDSLALCMQLWAVVFSLAALWGAIRRRRGASVWALGTGVCAGLGYLVRPEAALPLVLAMGLWAFYAASGRADRRIVATSLIALIGGFVACALPYMISIGGLTGREYFSSSPVAHAGMLAWAAAYPGPRMLLNRFVEAMHPAPAAMLLVWLIARAAPRELRRALARTTRLSPRRPSAMLMGATAALTAGVVLLRAGGEGVISHRYLAFTAAMLMPLAARGLLVLIRCAVWLPARIGRSISLSHATRIASMLVITGMMAHAMRPLHYGKGCYREAGLFAGREVARSGGFVLAYDPIVLHYAECPGEPIYDDNMHPHPFWHRTMTSGATLLVLSDRRRDADAEVSELVQSEAFAEVAAFQQRRGRRMETVRVYGVRRDALRARRPRRR